MSKVTRLGQRLYTGEVSYDFLGNRRKWYILSAVMIAIALAAVGLRGLSYGIEFEGGADFKAPTTVTATTSATASCRWQRWWRSDTT
jgi:preprotein translocase subunit SecF